MIHNSQNVRGFKRKTIEKTIRQKLKSWYASINDKELVKEIDENLVITGGAIASMLMGFNPNDYDIYFTNPQTATKVAKHYLQAYYGKETAKVSAIKVEETPDGMGIAIFIKSAGFAQDEDSDFEEYRYFESLPPSEMARFFDSETEEEEQKTEKKKYRPIQISSNAITLTNDVQLVLRFCGNPATIHEFYDFVHCTNYYTKETGVVLNEKALEALLTKELKYVGSKFPLCTMFRMKKFIKRGFTITAGEMMKIAWDINKLDLNDPNVLREQLIGMDAAYFHQVLAMLKKEGWGTAGFELDRTYLFEIVSRVFDTNDWDGGLEIEDHEG